jgi:hypothetical protein
MRADERGAAKRGWAHRQEKETHCEPHLWAVEANVIVDGLAVVLLIDAVHALALLAECKARGDGQRLFLRHGALEVATARIFGAGKDQRRHVALLPGSVLGQQPEGRLKRGHAGPQLVLRLENVPLCSEGAGKVAIGPVK